MSTTAAKILKQVEFYFSDSNLPKDKFLRGLAEQNDGYVCIATLASFARMKKLSTDINEVIAALRTSESLLEVDEKGENVRRTTPISEIKVNDNCWVYAKGFDKESELESLNEFLSTYGTVKCVRMRRYEQTKFKGSVFAEFSTEEEAKKFLEAEIKSPVTFKDEGEEKNILLTMTKEAYVDAKKQAYEARKASKGTKRSREEPAEKVDDEPMREPVLNMLVKIVGLEATTSREDLRDVVLEVGGTVRHVDFSRGLTEGWVRLQDEDALGAVKIVEALAEKKSMIMGVLPTYTALTGDEEQKYWVDLWVKQKARRDANGGKKGRQFNNRNKRQRR